MDPSVPYLLPKSDMTRLELKKLLNYNDKNNNNDDKDDDDDDDYKNFGRFNCIGGFHNCTSQVLRSCGLWSNGIQTEHSIQNAYVDAIANANHYIYIENQFFISGLPGSGVMNQVADAILARVTKAFNVS